MSTTGIKMTHQQMKKYYKHARTNSDTHFIKSQHALDQKKKLETSPKKKEKIVKN